MKTIINSITTFLLLTNFAHADFVDTLFSKQWALKNIGQTIYIQDSDLTRQKIVGTPGVDINFVDTANLPAQKSELIVAVIDSGIDLNHPDLQGKIWYNQKLCLNAPNAKNLPCNGYNFLDNNTNLTDDVGHGTHVAGIIAANRNSIGVVGAADPRIKIMPLKVLNNSVNGFVYNGKLITDVVADAMVFAIKNGAEVINLSLGWPKLIDTPKVRAAFQLADEQNVVVVAASGNNNKDLPTFPCSYESVICVGAHDNQGNLTDFSNHGAKVDVVAPGEYIVSANPSNLESRVLRIKNYEVKRGSSQAAPFVTASIATLKLLNSNLRNDDVRSLLFQSVKSNSNATKRFVKYGRLDQLALLESVKKPKIAFLNPQIKNITEIKFKKADPKFQFDIPLKNIGSQNYTGTVCLKTAHADVKLTSDCMAIDSLLPGSTQAFHVNGELLNLSSDSQIVFELNIDDHRFSLPVFFSRDLSNDQDVIQTPVVGGNFDDMAVISNGRKLSRMGRIIDKLSIVNSPEYYFLEKLKQTDLQTNVSILTKVGSSDGTYKVKNILISKLNKLLSVHRQDINQDGKLDYMFYGLSADKQNLKLYFYDQDLNPLFGSNSEWTWPLSTFEGLPIDGAMEKFDWTQIKNPNLGTLLVPSITRTYDMPEEDNSKNILDRVVQRSLHQYYLNPTVSEKGVLINLRVLDSVTMMKKLKSQLGVDDSYMVAIVKSLPITTADYLSGALKILLKVFNDESTRYFSLQFSKGGLVLQEIKSDLPLESSAIYNVFDLETKTYANEQIFSNLLNRSRANLIVNQNGNISYGADLINPYENPIINLIGATKLGADHFYLMENRYSVSFTDQLGSVKYELPVYRDSSFPGQNFSETLNFIVADGRPGVFVNSTLIFGERLYAMVGTENGLVRPLSLSVTIPDNCIPLNPELMEDKSSSQFMFLCSEPSRQISVKSLPMSQN